LDVAAAARVVDQRGQLTDRIATLLDLRLRPRPSRLAPVLVAQALALGVQWQPQRIVPRRIPRSVYLVAAAMLALASTPLIAPEPPPPQAATAAGPGTMVLDGALTVPLPERSGGGGARAALPDASEASRSGGSPPPGNNLPETAAMAVKQPSEPPDAPNLLGILPDKLRQALLSAFHAEPMDGPRQLAARTDTSGAPGNDQRNNADRDDATNAHKREAPPRDAKDGEANAAPPRQPHQSAGSQAGEARPPDQDTQHPDQKFEGSSPAAGTGSSPGGLMDPKGPHSMIVGDGPKTFKLTITSFLRAVEQKGAQPRQQTKHINAGGAAGITEATAPLNDRQLNDDALRKAEIPAEYEDIVRRVYSAKVDE